MLTLPEYPWEQLAPYRARAAEHPDGVADLSIGTPVDPTPELIQHALRESTDAHGYPTTAGTSQLREAIASWYVRRRGAQITPAQVIPSIGSKEFIAWLPLLMGLGPGDAVVRPEVAYPTYDIGAQLVGATPVAADSLSELDTDTRSRVKLVWTNSPANPTGRVDTADQVREKIAEARAIGAVLAGDECYAELGWDQWEPGVPSVLDPAVNGGDTTGLLSVYSLSKQSNLAGYRAAFAAGDEQIITTLINSRKHAGMIVPAPIQSAMVAALNDDAHVQEQKDRYRIRRGQLLAALTESGLHVDHSEAGLYLWTRTVASAGRAATAEDTWNLVQRFADAGIVVGPGVFYGEAGNGYVRVAITATDDAVAQAVSRIRRGI
ncbi:succinyldiaminopimelate transaminase [Citricoccus muralis]|uniref:Aminotransferase n=1 Tax=Citricoccus muralis TaxID=169134 RepID=A0ABY8H3I7_9MICC|nr:succinyldiaminopimelate transaminase [Citricoccus muralis]WFP15698.1 succinyldiaminopimelate transaminase [Citricoccus muralis]